MMWMPKRASVRGLVAMATLCCLLLGQQLGTTSAVKFRSQQQRDLPSGAGSFTIHHFKQRKDASAVAPAAAAPAVAASAKPAPAPAAPAAAAPAAAAPAVAAPTTKPPHLKNVEWKEVEVVFHTKKEDIVPPVSTAMRCVVNLTIQYFLVYTLLAVLRTLNQFRGRTRLRGAAQDVLEVATSTVNLCPMLAVLFVAARMRALQITQGKGAPQYHCQVAMEFCAYAVLAQTLIVIMLPMFTGEMPRTDPDGNLLADSDAHNTNLLGLLLTGLRYFAMLILYVSVVVVMVAIINMDARSLNVPAGTWPGGAPPVSPAVDCTMNLAIQYFAVYLLLALARTMNQLAGVRSSPSEVLLKLCASTVNVAPMLCILFVGARMRALQIDPKHGNPQRWAQDCFYLCTYSVLVSTLLVVLVVVFGGQPRQGSSEGDVEFVFERTQGLKGWVALILTAVRYCALLALYGGFTAVIVSVYLIEAKDGKPTPPVSPTMRCVMNLTVQFFAVFLCTFVVGTYKDITGRTPRLAVRTLEGMRTTVQFCPMLCVLFVGTRMRALQITDQLGAPQGWAQDCMYLCTYAVLTQAIMVLVLGYVTGDAAVDSDGNPKMSSKNSRGLEIAVIAVRYTAFICLYGGVVGIMCSLYMITPETANGHGGYFGQPVTAVNWPAEKSS